MNIAINACHYNNREPSGARNRFTGLYSALIQKAPDDNFFILEPKDANVSTFFISNQNIHYIKTGLLSNHTIQRHLLGKLTLNRLLDRNNIHVFDTSYLPLIKYKNGCTILTIHDLRYLHFPEWYSLTRRWISRMTTMDAIKKADIVITVSQTMKGEILNLFPSARIEVIGNALSEEFLTCNVTEDMVRKVRDKYKLSNEFLLTVGHVEKRKNYINLLKAILILKKRNINIPLIAVGKSADDTEQVLDFINNNKLYGSVRFFYGLSETELVCFYKAATLLVFPSFYEGFGMPLLEAMYLNIPLICSDINVFRELVGGGANYFNPHDPESIADSVSLIINGNLKVPPSTKIFNYTWDYWSEEYLKILKQI